MKVDFDDKYLVNFIAQTKRKEMGLGEYLGGLLDQVNERITEQEGFEVSLEDKIVASEWVIEKGLQEFGVEKVTMAWTGGKDSTLLMWMVKRVKERMDLDWPKIMFINEGRVFEEVKAFCQQLAGEWGFSYDEVSNKDVLEGVKKVGDEMKVSKLNKRNRNELKRMEYTDRTLIFEPESMVGNHLMKTVVQNMYIEDKGVGAMITGIRWDEQEARAGEEYFSKRGDDHTPKHVRVHPILHFDEREIWQVTKKNSIPYCKLYEEGYRSLGACWERDIY